MDSNKFIFRNCLPQILSSIRVISKIGLPQPSFKLNQTKGIVQGSYTLDSADNTKIQFIKKGASTKGRVIFIHGTPGNAINWIDFINAAPENIEYISISRLGYNPGQGFKPQTSFAKQVEAIEPLLEPVGDKYPIVVGHSMGATLALKIAILYPNRVSAVVPISGAFSPELEKIYQIQYFADKYLYYFLPPSYRVSNRELLAFPEELRIMNEELGNIRDPILFIHGDEDYLVPYENLKYITERLPQTSVLDAITLKGVDHFVIWRKTDFVINIIRQLSDKFWGM